MAAQALSVQTLPSQGALSASSMAGQKPFVDITRTGQMPVNGSNRSVTAQDTLTARTTRPRFFSQLITGAEVSCKSLQEYQLTVATPPRTPQETAALQHLTKTGKNSKIPVRVKTDRKSSTEVGFLTAVRKPYFVPDNTPSAETVEKYQEHRREFAFRRTGKNDPKAFNEAAAPRTIKAISDSSYKRLMGGWTAHHNRTVPEPVINRSRKKVSRVSPDLLKRPDHKKHEGYMPTAQFVSHEYPKTLRKYDQATQA